MTRKSIFAIVCIALLLAALLAACNTAPDAADSAVLPVNAADSLPAAASEPEPEPEPEPLSPFDEHVTDYQTLNDVLLIDADASIKEDFFNELYLQDYTKILAAEDKETVTDANAPLLDAYIEYLNNMHTVCEFDTLVEQFVTENPDTNLSEDATPLYEYLRANDMDSYYVQTRCCDNEYVNGFIAWDKGIDSYDPNEAPEFVVITDPSQLSRSTEEEIAEREKQLEEYKRQMEEEAARRRQEMDEDAKDWNAIGTGGNF